MTFKKIYLILKAFYLHCLLHLLSHFRFMSVFPDLISSLISDILLLAQASLLTKEHCAEENAKSKTGIISFFIRSSCVEVYKNDTNNIIF